MTAARSLLSGRYGISEQVSAALLPAIPAAAFKIATALAVCAKKRP